MISRHCTVAAGRRQCSWVRGPCPRACRYPTGAPVTYTNPPVWTDGELLRELRAALREQAVDEDFIRAARAAFTRRTAGADPGPWRPGQAGPAS